MNKTSNKQPAAQHLATHKALADGSKERFSRGDFSPTRSDAAPKDPADPDCPLDHKGAMKLKAS